MELALVASVVIALVVFAFVLEPVIRARGDQVVVDEVALPLPPEEHLDPDAPESFVKDAGEPAERPAVRTSHPLDRPAGSDAR